MAETSRRMTTKAIQRLLKRMEGLESGARNRIETLEQGLPEDLKPYFVGRHRNPVEFGTAQRIKALIEAHEEQFGYFAFQAALQLVLGEDVNPKLVARLYEDVTE